MRKRHFNFPKDQDGNPLSETTPSGRPYSQRRVVKRLRKLDELINKYRHRYGKSDRLINWAHEWDNLIREYPKAADEYARQIGAHDGLGSGGDMLA